MTTPPTSEAHVIGSELTISETASTWNDAQVATLRQLGLEDATEGDLRVFFHQCQRTGLDPFARQIYMIGRQQTVRGRDGERDRKVTKYTIQTGIDGFRLVARRAASRAHETIKPATIEWCGEDGVWRDVWIAPKGFVPSAARATVIRDGEPSTAVAAFWEYAQTKYGGDLNQMWAEKPSLMIGKCAEALALRKAYPQDLAGVYTDDEMSMSQKVDLTEEGRGQVEGGRASARARQSLSSQAAARYPGRQQPDAALDAQFARIDHLFAELEITGADKLATACAELGAEITAPAQITSDMADVLIGKLEDRVQQMKVEAEERKTAAEAKAYALAHPEPTPEDPDVPAVDDSAKVIEPTIVDVPDPRDGNDPWVGGERNA